jgi:DNA-binding SARP family transcriptional activator
MPTNTISIRMLGEFSVDWNNNTISDKNNRMRKVWLLLAYLIYNRTQHITQDHYISLLQGKNSEESADPGGNLKAMFFRLRSMLAQLGDAAGHDLIIRQSGSYTWNTDIPLVLDIEEFEQLCRQGNETEDCSAKLDLYLKALSLYQGDYLPKLASESWVMPISAYYHQLYLDTTEKTLILLEDFERCSDISALCQNVLKIESYHESIYQHFMRAKIALGDASAALQIYEEMSELLFATFGVMPSDESRTLYREASRESGENTIPVGTVREQLREEARKSAAQKRRSRVSAAADAF